jgi:hypothetical protein
MQATAQANLQMRGNANFDNLWQEAQSHAQETNFADKWQTAVDWGERASTSVSQSTGDALATKTAGGLQEQQQARSDMQSSLQTAERYQSMQARLEESGAQVGANAAMAFRDYMTTQQNAMTGSNFTPQQADQVMTQSQGSGGQATAAAGVITSLMSGFIATQGEALAGMGDAPSVDRVGSADADFSVDVARLQRGAVPAAFEAAGNAERAAAGVPSAAEVTARADVQSNAVAAGSTDVARRVASGNTDVSADGGATRENVENATRRDNMSLSGAAIAAAGDNVVEDMKAGGRSVKGLADQFIDEILE